MSRGVRRRDCKKGWRQSAADCYLTRRTRHQIAKHIQSTTDDILRLEHGSLYPTLHRLKRQGWVAAKWEVLGKRKRECKYYRLTPAGRKQLTAEESNWNRVAKAIARVMRVPVKV
jgi:PadR family transcriptional regulator, regulatory protein PadR